MDRPQTGQEINDGANPVDTTGLCLLSLDGGGVRGLSTLHVLKVIMDQLNYERKQSGLGPVKPCDIFDLIGGTSTGGLIAIMLGRLEMDVDECIAVYNELSSGVFAKPQRRYRVDLRASIAPKFDSAKLRDAILKIITSQGLSPEAPFDDGQDRGCKTFVCAASKDLYGIHRLRSYSYRGKTFLPSTICEAALATSAASGFFNPVKIGARRFVDGALGANNPVEQVEGEASDIWCHESGDLKPLVKCFLSIGTGNPGKMPIEDRVNKFISKTLVGIATETEKTAALFIKRWRQHYDDGQFFRFNVEQGLQNVGLAEHDKQGVIEAATEQYMADIVQESRVRECVQNLKQKQDRPGKFHTLTVFRQHAARSHPQHFIPFSKNRRFVGRTEVLPLIEEKLFVDDGPQRVAIVGLGGVGKTQVALQIAYWTKENKEDWSVFWLPALSMAAFEQSCAELAEKLNIRAAEEGAKDSVLRYLSSEQSSRWLLIIDNTDDMDMLFGSEGSVGIYDYLPENNDNGRILFTTRSRDVAMAAADDAVVEMEEMSPEEALMFWEKIGPGNSADKATVAELLHELTYLPLAISQAAAYLKRNRIPISKYLSLLRATEDDIVGLMSHEFRDPTRYKESKHAVATTWLVSFEQILKTDRAAADILSFLSQIEPRAVPQFILPKPGTEEALTHAIGTLSGYAFIEKRDGEDIYDMHRLVHLAAGVWYRKEKAAANSRKAAIAQLEGVFPTNDWENREQWRLCMPHALRALRSNGKATEWDGDGCGLGFWAGRCLQEDGRIGEAVELLEHVVAVREQTLSESHPSRLASQHELAGAYQANGQVKEAVTLLEHVIAVREQTLSESHPDRLASQHTLAGAYRANGQVKEAVKLLEHVVASMWWQFGSRHSQNHTLTDWHHSMSLQEHTRPMAR
ncbi:uncharacterized protein DNG_05189 [Cephalotrichum gorgonifer]|uniref:PNPLA domain-containing protein n=1 Tax=Cephalotrichum gorgonifer TaxID=2041049 RepID=A0AAE8MXG0_9PEZI|nr:uncharacterized protein DNG_05189 [Cephalotrichum gorgonifer]